MQAIYQPGKAWRMAALLCLFMAINAVDKITVGLLAIPIMESLQLTPAQFGILSSSFFWLFAVSGVAGGFMANRISTTVMLLCMCAAWSLVQIPLVLSSSFAVFVGARILLGMAEGPAFPVAVHACYKWFPNEKRDLPISLLAQGAALGLLAAGLAIPQLTAHWGWRSTFIATAAIGTVWLLLWRIWASEGPLDDTSKTTPASGRSERIAYWRLLTDPTLASGFFMHFVAYWSLALSLTWLPAYLQGALGYSPIEAGRLYAAMVAVAAPITVGTSALARYLLSRGVSTRAARGRLAGLTLTLAGTALILLWGANLTPTWRVVLLGLALGLTPAVYSLVPAMIGEVVPASQRGAMLALDNSFASLAGIVAPLVTGFMVKSTTHAAGYESAFALGGILLVVGGLVGACVANPGKSAAALRARPHASPMRASQLPAID